MRPDVLALKGYYASPLGHYTAQAVAACLPQGKPGQRILILGYGAPFLKHLARDADRVVAAMPARQGAIALNAGAARRGKSANVACLADVEHLPFVDAVFDRILLIHCLEFSGRVGTALNEIARVLAPSGSVYCVVPNRVGAWCRAESTPFGNGRPFSSGQLSDLLREAHLAPMRWQMALMLPPVKAFARWMPQFEAFGRSIWGKFGGVYVVEAKKEVFAAKLQSRAAVSAVNPLRAPVFSPANAIKQCGR